ncbi:MAG: hypothetical protein IJI38_02120 [Clostridia bacterium]|nr:hypothetical protein [Clostridia bacterium]
MKTQVSILVKNENILSRFMSFMWFVNIFKKMKVNVYIDKDPDNLGKTPDMQLKASSTPYEIDLEPGQHLLVFTDPRAGGKAAFRAVTGAMMGAAFSGAGGGSMIAGAAMGADAAGGNSAGDGYASFNLQEGDVFKISVKPTRKGSVKVKAL